MAAEWDKSFSESKFSNQWEHIYAAGWIAAIKSLEGVQNQTNNNARDVITALEKELHEDYQPCHHFTRDDVLQWLRQHTPIA